MTNPLENIHQGGAEDADEKSEAAKRALGDFEDGEIRNRILEYPELVDLLVRADSQGRTVSTGFFRDIRTVDPKLASEYLNTLAKKEGVLPDVRVDRVIGKDAESILNAFRADVLRDRSVTTFHEREKTADEMVMIHRAIENVNRLRVKHGLPPAEFDQDDVRMLAIHKQTDDGRICGGHANGESATIYEGTKEAARFDNIQHELIHLWSYSAINVPQGRDQVRTYRTGMQVESQHPDASGEYQSFLLPLNKAITEENARRFTMSIPEDDPELGELTKKRKKSLEEMEVIRRRGNVLPDPEMLEQELFFADVNWENKTMNMQGSSYHDERQAMWGLFDKIHEKNPGAFPEKSQEEAREELFDMVTKASLDGNVLPFGRLMNETFDRGTFRNYGHLQTVQEILSFVSALDKMGAQKDANEKR